MYNPLDKRSIAENVARALLDQDVHNLPPDPFQGAGIYAIYYTGDIPLYEKIAERNQDGRFEAPIYIGKAVPRGARKGGGLDIPHTNELFSRLREHGESVRVAENLNLADFYCRFLVVDDIWIPLGESLLIEKFSPVWNKLLDGFGNHDPGSGRYNSQIPFWDMIHPGRGWAARLQPNTKATVESLETAIITYLNDLFA